MSSQYLLTLLSCAGSCSIAILIYPGITSDPQHLERYETTSPAASAGSAAIHRCELCDSESSVKPACPPSPIFGQLAGVDSCSSFAAPTCAIHDHAMRLAPLATSTMSTSQQLAPRLRQYPTEVPRYLEPDRDSSHKSISVKLRTKLAAAWWRLFRRDKKTSTDSVTHIEPVHWTELQPSFACTFSLASRPLGPFPVFNTVTADMHLQAREELACKGWCLSCI